MRHGRSTKDILSIQENHFLYIMVNIIIDYPQGGSNMPINGYFIISMAFM